MARKRGKKAELIGIVLSSVSAAGVILALVGVCVPWFMNKIDLTPYLSSGYSYENVSVGLFDDGLGAADFPIAAVQAFALLSLIFAAVCCAVTVLEAFGPLKLPRPAKLVLSELTAVLAILTVVFAYVYAGSYRSVMTALYTYSFTVYAGAWLTLIGALFAAHPLLLVRK